MKRYIIAIIFIAGLAGAPLAAETYTLQECIDIAMKSNHDIRRANEELKQAWGGKIEAISGFLPKVGLMSYMARKSPSDIPDSVKNMIGKDFTAMLSDETCDVQLSLQQNLFTWGKVYYGNRQAQMAYLMTKQKHTKTKNDLVFNIEKAYYGVLLTRKMTEIAGEMVGVTQAQLKVTESFYNQGKVSSYDVSKVKVQLTNVKTGLLKAKNASQLAVEGLFNLMGKEKTQDVELTTVMSYEPVEPDYNKALKEAIENKPEFELLQLQEKMSKIALCLARSSNKPNIIFSGYFDWIRGVDGFDQIFDTFRIDDWYRTWNARIVLNFPVFNGLQTTGKVTQSQAQLNQMKISLEQLTEGTKVEIRQIIFNIKQSEEMILAQKENTSAARENLNIAQQRYKTGLISDVEVREAQLALGQAESNYHQALYDYNVAIAALNRAVGK